MLKLMYFRCFFRYFWASWETCVHPKLTRKREGTGFGSYFTMATGVVLVCTNDNPGRSPLQCVYLVYEILFALMQQLYVD